MAHYVYDDLNNKVEALSKQEIYALIDEVIDSGTLPVSIQAAFVTMLKSIVDGQAYKIGFCTQAQYNQLVAQGLVETNGYYFITDDTTEDDLKAYVDNAITAADQQIVSDITNLKQRVGSAEININDLVQLTAKLTPITGHFTWVWDDTIGYGELLNILAKDPNASFYIIIDSLQIPVFVGHYQGLADDPYAYCLYYWHKAYGVDARGVFLNGSTEYEIYYSYIRKDLL